MGENYIGCRFCKRLYSIVDNWEPKVLECGHSVCSVCLASHTKFKGRCPICEVPLTKPFEKYSVNHDLILACEVLMDLFNFTKNFIIKNLENLEVDDSENREGDFKKMLEKMLVVHKEAASKINTFDYLENEKIFIREPEKNIFRIPNPTTPSKFLNFANYVDKNHFIYEINVRLERNECVYVCDIMYEVNDGNEYNYQWKYGKLDYDKDWINVHCLSMSKIEERYTCVSLQDLKRCMELKDLTIFLNVGSQKLTLVPANSSSLTLQFLKLCTGEDGVMLKGSTVRFRSQYIKIDGLEDELDTPPIEENITPYCVVDKLVPGYREYTDYDVSIYSKEKEGEHFSANELIVQYYCNYIFIQKVDNENILYKNVVAKMYNEDIELSDVHGAKVDDCGISICVKGLK